MTGLSQWTLKVNTTCGVHVSFLMLTFWMQLNRTFVSHRVINPLLVLRSYNFNYLVGSNFAV